MLLSKCILCLPFTSFVFLFLSPFLSPFYEYSAYNDKGRAQNNSKLIIKAKSLEENLRSVGINGCQVKVRNDRCARVSPALARPRPPRDACGIIPLHPGLGGEAEANAREHAARRDARLQPFGRAREKGVAHWPATRSRPVVHLWERPVTG